VAGGQTGPIRVMSRNQLMQRMLWQMTQ